MCIRDRVTYDPLVTDYDAVAAAMQKLADVPDADSTAENGKLVTIPVCYGGEFGPDLPFVARHAGLTEQEVIALHTGRDYRIYMLGFLPGFPYLGGLDERLFTPRLGTSRTAIPAGSVGIGGEQTGIYPDVYKRQTACWPTRSCWCWSCSSVPAVSLAGGSSA